MEPTMNRRSRRRRREMLWVAVAAAVLAVLALLAVWIIRSRPKPKPWEANVIPREGKPLSVVWSYRPTAFEIPRGVDVQAPTWLYVEADEMNQPVLHSLNDMGYAGLDVPAYVAEAHGAGVKIWATVVSFDSELSRQVVADEDSRGVFTAALAAWAREAGVDGVCFDFEEMDPADKERYTALVQAAVDALPEMTVAVAVTVPLGYDDPTNWYQCYDREALARTADYLALMTYDAHWDAVQPVAPLPWVRRAVERLLVDVPSDKVLLGIPFYGVDFYALPEDEATPKRATLSAAAMEKLLREGTIDRDGEPLTVASWQDRGTWVEDWAVMRYEFTDTEGYFHRVWMEDARTLEEKGALMDRYGLAGAAVWRQSQGTEGLWAAFDEMTRKREEEPHE